MSMRKRRTLSGVVAYDTEVGREETKLILPATSKIISTNNNKSEIVRGTEFLVDTTDCRPWKFHNRDSVWMNVDKCQDLISSIRKNGQKVPIFARKLENDTEGKSWEIIAGRRRWFACGHLGIKVRVKAVEASDRECAILMNLENKDRNDISEFEDAVSYKQQLDAKLFDSQDEMASALDLKKSKLSKMISASRILSYPEIMGLFDDITLLKINPVYSLVLAIEKNKKSIDAINEKAQELEVNLSARKNKVKTNVIINELMKFINESEKKVSNYPKCYNLNDKTVLKAVQFTSRKIVFEFNKSNIPAGESEKVKSLVLEALEDFF